MRRLRRDTCVCSHTKGLARKAAAWPVGNMLEYLTIESLIEQY